MMNYEEIIRLRRQAAQRDFEASLIPGMTGAWVNGTLVASDEAGTIFVRMGAVTQDDLRPAVKATNAVVDTDVNIPVFLWYVNGVLDIYSINSQLAKEKFGAAVGNKATPRRAGDLSQEWVTGRNLKPGRVYIRAGALEAGMMEVTAGEFDYIDTNGDPKKWRSFPDSAALDISGSEPGSGKGRWVRITFDPDATSPTLVANDGTAMLPELLTPENANDIAIPDGHLTLDFYKYLEGDTPYNLADESRWLFGRHLFNGGSGGGAISVTDGTTTVNPATAMEFDGNFVVTDAGGGIAQIAGPSGGATLYAPTLIYELTLGSNGTFDTNTPDPNGRSGVAGYNDLTVRITGRNSTTTDRTIDMAINADTTAGNYQQLIVYGSGSGTGNALRAYADARTLTGIAGNGTNDLSTVTVDFYNYAGTSRYKQFSQREIRRDSATTSGILFLGGTWENTAAITRLQFSVTTDTNFEAGTTIQIWGWREVSVGAADLDISSISPVTPVVGDYLVGGDVSNAENTFKATIEDVLELATYEMTSTATGNIDDLDIGDAPIVELRMNNASTATIRGLVGSGKGGQIVKIFSVGAGNVELAHQNAGSTAANRLINAVTGMNTPLAAGFGTATYVYDATTQRWRLQSHNQGAAIAYTPTWTTSGTAPTLGNGTITGSYLITGNLIFGQISLTAGSTTNPGTGAFFYSLPTAVSFAAGSGTHRDTGTAQYNLAVVKASSTTVALIAYNVQVTAAAPFAFGNTDASTISFYGVAT